MSSAARGSMIGDSTPKASVVQAPAQELLSHPTPVFLCTTEELFNCQLNSIADTPVHKDRQGRSVCSEEGTFGVQSSAARVSFSHAHQKWGNTTKSDVESRNGLHQGDLRLRLHGVLIIV